MLFRSENGALRRNLVAQPTPDEDELTFTMHLACDALLGVCAMVHGIIGGPEDLQLGELIRSMPDRASQDIGEIER